MSSYYRFCLLALLFAGTTGCSSTAKTPVAAAEVVDASYTGAEPSQQENQDATSTAITVSRHHPEFHALENGNEPVKSEVIQTGRYSAIAPVPTPEQAHILDVVITVTLPKSDVQTVGQGIRYLLRRSGYQMVNPDKLPPDALWLFSNPLPDVHRQLGPITLKDAINTLAAPAFTLIEDPVHRLISFQLSPNIVLE